MNLHRLIHRNIAFRVESLHEYNSFNEANFDNELTYIQKKYDAAQKEYEEFKKENPNHNQDDDYMIDYFDDLSYSHTKIQDNIILKHRNSIVFLLYSLIEVELRSYAKHNILKTSVFSIDDLKGNSIFEKFKLFTSKTNPILYKSISEELIFLDRVRILRNFITHNSNSIKSDHSDFKKVKEFSENNFELQKIGIVYNTKIETYFIKLNNKDFIEKIFEMFNVLLSKLYLEN